MAPVEPPVQPMLASLVDELPQRDDVLFEPKWDGFRCLVFVDDDVFLQSRTGKPFNRYFPEVVDGVRDALDRPVVLDGELVVAVADEHGDRLDWDALSERIHPASSRVRELAERTPARFVAFDLLALDERDLRGEPFSHRREVLDSLRLDRSGLRTTPITGDRDTAAEWFRVFEGAGLDGVVGKGSGEPYRPGKRSMVKLKHSRTADCVVAGLRWHANTEPGTAVGSLLLGLHDGSGVLHHVGVVGAFSAARRRELAEALAGWQLSEERADEHPWLGSDAGDGRRLPGSVNRWRSSEAPWQPLEPRLVVEVGYDHTEGAFPPRFRHTTQFHRWRPDRDPGSCTYEQLAEPARYDLDAVLRGEVLGARGGSGLT